MVLNQSEKAIIFRNFRRLIAGDVQNSTFDDSHLIDIHKKLCKGLEHKDIQPGIPELKLANLKAFGFETQNTAEKIALGGGDSKFVALRAAHYLVRIEKMNVFKDFNSLVAKTFSHNLAQSAGLKINWAQLDTKELNDSIRTAVDSKFSDLPTSNLVKMIESGMSPMCQLKSKNVLVDFNDLDKRAKQFKDSYETDKVSRNTMKL